MKTGSEGGSSSWVLARLAARWRRRPGASRRTVAGPSLVATGWRWRVI